MCDSGNFPPFSVSFIFHFFSLHHFPPFFFMFGMLITFFSCEIEVKLCSLMPDEIMIFCCNVLFDKRLWRIVIKDTSFIVKKHTDRRITANATSATADRENQPEMADPSSSRISVRAMQFTYEGQPPLFADFNLDVSPGSRCLLVGANGSGKTTLLKILAGKHMVGGRDVVRVLNCSAFHDTQLVCSGDLSYLGGSWTKSVASAGEVPHQGDISAEQMIFGVEGSDPDRREDLIQLLDIDLQWRMHKVSDGQRRRVQICLGLLHPFKVLLLDEVTVDLDVVARMDLLDFFKKECDERGATIVYATHIFDGLETWATDLAYIQEGELKRNEKLSVLPELKSSVNLLSVVESWLRVERESEKKKNKPIASNLQAKKTSPFDSSPFRSSRHMAYYR